MAFLPLIYEIQLPKAGEVGPPLVVVRARSAEGAAEVVRILLAQQDRDMVEIRIITTIDPNMGGQLQ